MTKLSEQCENTFPARCRKTGRANDKGFFPLVAKDVLQRSERKQGAIPHIFEYYQSVTRGTSVSQSSCTYDGC